MSSKLFKNYVFLSKFVVAHRLLNWGIIRIEKQTCCLTIPNKIVDLTYNRHHVVVAFIFSIDFKVEKLVYYVVLFLLRHLLCRPTLRKEVYRKECKLATHSFFNYESWL